RPRSCLRPARALWWGEVSVVRRTRSAPSPACGGGVGRGRLQMLYHVDCPLPVPPAEVGCFRLRPINKRPNSGLPEFGCKRGRGRCGTVHHNPTREWTLLGGPVAMPSMTAFAIHQLLIGRPARTSAISALKASRLILATLA